MPNVFKFNLIQADFPFIAEDYGSIADTLVQILLTLVKDYQFNLYQIIVPIYIIH